MKINQNPDQFLYYPLLNFERKSMKIDNKFIENQWKSHEILAQNDPFLNEIEDKIDYKLNQILAKIESNPDQKWGGTRFEIMDLGWGVIFDPFWPITPITNLKMLGGYGPWTTYKISKCWEVIHV